jgi:hypothetical protein
MLIVVAVAKSASAQNSWSFVMLGDTRGNRETTTNGVSPYLNAIAQKIATLSPDLVLVCGDLVNGNDVPTNSPLENYAIQFTNWMTVMQPVFNYSTGTGSPIYPVRGNHENCDNEGPTVHGLKKAYYNTFKDYVPLNGPNYGSTNDQTGFSYSFTYNNATFVVADQYFYYDDTPDLEGYHDLDRSWVTQQFHQANSPYKVFMAHEPIFNSEKQEPGGFFGSNTDGLRTRKEFWNALGTNGVQLYLTGHIHNETVVSTTNDYGNTIIQLMAGNGGAPLEGIGDTHEPGLEVLYTNATEYGFALATVQDDAMTIHYYLLNTNDNSWEVADYITRIGPNQVVPVTPTNITYTATATTLTLIWPKEYTGWLLQAQTNVLSIGIRTNWASVPGSSITNQMTVPIGRANGSVFYRLFLP